MKNSFLLYTEYAEHVELLSLEQRGQLFTAILCHAQGLSLPDMDGETRMAFSFIRSRMDRDSAEYEKKSEARKEAGKKGGRPSARKENIEEAKGDFGSEEKAKKANGYFAFDEKPDESKEKQKNPDTVLVLDTDTDKDKKTYVGREAAKDQSKAVKNVIDYLNQKAGTAFKDQSKDSRKHIIARFNEGYTLNDFYHVIDIKTEEWKGTDMEKFLRPCTLFGTKFEGYRNQKWIKPKGHHDFFGRETDCDALVNELNGF